MDTESSQPLTKEGNLVPETTSSAIRNNKRKQDFANTTATIKKPAITAKQPGPNHRRDESTESSSDSESTTSEQSPTKKKINKVPPIILRTKTNPLRTTRELKKEGITIEDAVNRSGCIKIHVESAKISARP
ncbi:hypothetical protein CBL_20383 [Carabus blaptoides fortunei]